MDSSSLPNSDKCTVVDSSIRIGEIMETEESLKLKSGSIIVDVLDRSWKVDLEGKRYAIISANRFIIPLRCLSSDTPVVGSKGYLTEGNQRFFTRLIQKSVTK